MSKKIIFFLLGTLSLVISLVWGLTNNQNLEPWTVAIGALLFLLGLFFNDTPVSSPGEKGDIKQGGFFSFFNSSKVKKHQGKVRQRNWFSFGNKQEVDNSETTGRAGEGDD